MTAQQNPGRGNEIVVILSTMPAQESPGIVQKLVGSRLVACANVLPVQSCYWWKGELCTDAEHLIIMKTAREKADELVAALRLVHPYDIPEIIVLPVIAGHQPYLDWVHEETGAAG